MATPDPYDAFSRPVGSPKPTVKERSAEADIEQSSASTAASQASADRTRTLTPIEARKGKAEVTKAEQDAIKAEKEAKDAAEAAEKAKKSAKADVENLLYNVNQARKNVGFWSTGIPGQVTQGVWGSSSKDLSAALKGIKSPIVLEKLREAKSQSQTGASGFGALSERELGLLESAIASLEQSQSQDQLAENLNRVEMHFRRVQAFNAGIDPDTPEGAKMIGLPPPSDDGDPAPPAGAKPTADLQEKLDPALAGVDATVNRMIRAGRTADEIRAWMNTVQPGLGDRAQNIQENIDYWKQGGEPSVSVEKQIVPAEEGLSKTLGSAIMSAPGAAAAGFSSGFTSGTMDEMTGQQAKSQAVMDYLREQNPWLYGLGEAGGQIAQYATAAKLLGPLAARYGIEASPMAGDVIQSSLYGAGTAQPGDRFSGAVSGAITGGLGNKVTRLGTRAGGRLIEGVRDEGARLLDKAGVPMTVGQIVGGGVKRAEDKITSWPIIGDAITARRKEGYEAFNKAAFDEALRPLGASVDELGEAGIAKAQQLVSDAYRQSLDGVALQADPDFAAQVFADALPDIRKIPRVGDELAGQVEDTLKTYFSGGQISGDMFQTALQELRGLRQSYRNDPQFGSRIGPRLAKVEDAMSDMIQRQAPDRAEMFSKANETYKRVGILGEAVEYAPAQSNGLVTPAQLRAKSRQLTRTYGGKRASARGARPFFELDKAGRTTLPSSYPDSGTAGRVLLPLTVAAGAGTGQFGANYASAKEGEEPDLAGPATTAAVAGLLAAAPYSKASQRMLQKTLLAERPAIVQSFGRGVGNAEDYLTAALRPYFAGMGVDTVPSPEPETDLQRLNRRYAEDTDPTIYSGGR